VNRRRTSLVLAGTVALGLATTACGSGFDATARQAYAPGDGVQATSGQIRVLNALVVAPEDGTTGVVLMAVANDGQEADELSAVESDAGTVEVSGSTELEPGSTVVLNAQSDTSATISGLDAEPGEEITLKVVFEQAEPVTLRTVVVAASGDYASVTPEAEPTPSATASATATAGETATPAPISSPSSS
jgi:copper(I)-binding protein